MPVGTRVRRNVHVAGASSGERAAEVGPPTLHEDRTASFELLRIEDEEDARQGGTPLTQRRWLQVIRLGHGPTHVTDHSSGLYDAPGIGGADDRLFAPILDNRGGLLAPWNLTRGTTSRSNRA